MIQAPVVRPSSGRAHRHLLLASRATITVVLLFLATSQPALAKTFVIPHVLDTAGKISNTQFTFDTTMFISYGGGFGGCPDGGGAQVDLYLYDNTSNQPMLSGLGTVVCNPCSYVLESSSAKLSLVVDDLIVAAGGFGQSSVKLGFAVIVVSGDPELVAVQSYIVNSHTSPSDLSTAVLSPDELAPVAAKSSGGGRRVLVLPHILEQTGRTSSTPWTFDTTMFATYVGGIGGRPDMGGAELEFYLYDEATGSPMIGSGGTDVCNPCVFPMGSSARKASINLDTLITTRGGGFDTAVKLGFGILVIGGNDPDGVSVQGFVVNSHTSSLDTSVFGFNPQEIASSSATGVGGEVVTVRRPSALQGYPNPFNPRTTLAFALAHEQQVTLRIYDAAGRLVRTLVDAVRPGGEQSVAWDGTDDGGVELASGVYHAQLLAKDGALRTKLVLVE